MRTINAWLLLTIVTLYAHAVGAQEYYSVSDQDGYSNLRNGPNADAKVLKQVSSGHCVVGLFDDKGWTKVIVVFTNESLEVPGFIHSSKLKRDNRCKDDSSVRSIPVGEVALEGLDFSKGFQEAAIWFKYYGKNLSDDGSYAEGYSEYVMHTLAKSFNSSVTFLSTSKKSDPAFAQFIFRHIDATGNASDLDVILKQARECLAQSSSEICERLQSKPNRL